MTLLIGCGGALLVSSAVAKDHAFEPATLSWKRADNAAFCPSEFEVARAVEGWLGPGALASPADAKLVVEASVGALPEGGFRVDIALIRGDSVVGRRELSSAEPNCTALAEQAALVIALTIDPEASLLEAPPATAPAPTPPPEPPPRPPTPPKAAPAAPPRSPASPEWEGDLELSVGVATGIVPEIAPGFFLRGRARPPGFALAIEFESAYFLPQDVELEPGRGADFALLYLGAAICNKPRRETRLRLLLCAGPDVAAITGQGYGFDRTPRFWGWTLAASARLRLGFRVARGVAVVLGPDILVPFGRDRFLTATAEGTEELFRMKAAGFGFELGAVWEL